jgi:hypothetical protein
MERSLVSAESRIEIPADGPSRPQHSMNCRPLPQGHG